MKAVLIIALSLFITTSWAQTKIGLSIGRKYTDIKYGYNLHPEQEGSETTIRDRSTYELKSNFVYGVHLNQYINEQLYISATASFEQKLTIFNALGIIGPEFTDDYFKVQNYGLSIHWQPIQYISIGGGGAYHKFYDYTDRYISFDHDRYELSYLLNLGFHYKGIFLDMSYWDSFHLKERASDTLRFLEPTHSYALTLGYLFELYNPKNHSKRRKGQDCPTF